jgi:glycosyltransferase involved in cell wall biosynthesis
VPTLPKKRSQPATGEKVSVVVPTYNQAQYLGACLDSIYFQDYPNIEIIVVNDASTDHTREILDEFTRAVKTEKASYASGLNESAGEIMRTEHYRYPRSGRQLKLIHNPENMGSTATYNRGFKNCSGTYCTYVASDDWCHPGMITSMVTVMESGGFDFVYSDMFVVDDDHRVLREFKLPDYSFQACFRDWYLCGVSKLYRRELHDRFGYYNEQYLANDHELYLRFAINGVRFKHIPKVLYSVRSHEKREENVHSPGNWSRLLNESCRLVKTARSLPVSPEE